MTIRIALVGCGKEKIPHPAPARDIYTGQLFRAALDYAEAHFDHVLVISAQHGAVPLDQHLDPYDLTMGDLSPEERAEWGHAVCIQIAEIFSPGASIDLVVLAGHAYAEPIRWQLSEFCAWAVEEPLADNTLRRIALGIRRFVIESPDPFIAPVADDLAAPTLIQTGYGERPRQTPRTLDLHKPLVAAFLAKHYGGIVGTQLTQPIGTITGTDHHSLTTATMRPSPAREPRVHQVRAFLSVFYGSEKDGQSLHEPLRTITTKDRFGLVTLAGTDYDIVDIGMRMLDPRRELLHAQFGRFGADYDLSAAPTKKAANLLVGNSVCPEAAEAVVRANLPDAMRRAA